MSDRPRRPVGLVIAAVAVLAAGLLLLLMLQGDDAPAEPVQATTYRVDPDDPRPSARPAAARQSAPAVIERERERGSAAGSGGDPGYTEMVIDGVRVRDHRRDRTQPIAVPTSPGTARSRRIPPALTREISQQILPHVTACAASVPPEARGAQPRAQGRVIIAIEGQRVRVTEASFQLADVVGAAVEPTQQCIAERARGVTLSAGDEADLSNYELTLSYGLP